MCLTNLCGRLCKMDCLLKKVVPVKQCKVKWGHSVGKLKKCNLWITIFNSLYFPVYHDLMKREASI